MNGKPNNYYAFTRLIIAIIGAAGGLSVGDTLERMQLLLIQLAEKFYATNLNQH